MMPVVLWVVIFLFALYYALYTLSFAIYFHKRGNETFTPQQKKIHSVMLWLIPFIWITVLKGMMKPLPKKHAKSGKMSGDSDASGADGFGDSWFDFFHHSVGGSIHHSDHGSSHFDGHDHGGHDIGHDGGH